VGLVLPSLPCPICSRSEVVIPSRTPVSIWLRLTHSLRVCGTQPILGAMDLMAAHSERYPTRDDAKSDVFGCIEGLYNRVRRHSHLDQLSHMYFERLRTAG
jgi:hypothetical protein